MSDHGQSRMSTPEYRAGHERIFGGKPSWDPAPKVHSRDGYRAFLVNVSYFPGWKPLVQKMGVPHDGS